MPPSSVPASPSSGPVPQPVPQPVPRRVPRPAPPWSDLAPDLRGLREEDWLALLLGPPFARWRERAAAILARRPLGELAGFGASRLAAEFQLGPVRATRLVAAAALARALEREERPARPVLTTARAVFEHLAPSMRRLERERFVALVLDGRHRLRRTVDVSEGTLTSSLVHPREVFAVAVREGAAAVIVVHNHPSGDPEPSAEDFEVTRRLHAAGRLLGIPLLDHVVVAEDGHVSLRERMNGVFAEP